MLAGCTNKEFHLGWYDKCKPSTIIRVKKQYPLVPQELLSCPSIPKPISISKQSDLAIYLVDLTVAGKQCEFNLKDVKILLTKFKSDANITKLEK